MCTPIVRLCPTPVAAARLSPHPVTGQPVNPVWSVFDGPVPCVGQIFNYEPGGCAFRVISVNVSEPHVGSPTHYDAVIDVA